MAITESRLVELAISGLEAQRTRIEEELADLRARQTSASNGSNPNSAEKSGRRGRTAAQKKAHSERMKAIWAERKRATKK